MLELNLDGLNLEFRIDNYRPSPEGSQEDDFCKTYLKLYSDDKMINYETFGETLLCNEVEEVHNRIGCRLISFEEEEEEIETVEDVFSFRFYSRSIYSRLMEWRVNLCDKGTITSNGLYFLLREKDIYKLYDYLQSVVQTEYEQTIYMQECRFYYPNMNPVDYEKIIRALAYRDDKILDKVMHGELVLKPVKERTREYIFDILGIKV